MASAGVTYSYTYRIYVIFMLLVAHTSAVSSQLVENEGPYDNNHGVEGEIGHVQSNLAITRVEGGRILKQKTAL